MTRPVLLVTLVAVLAGCAEAPPTMKPIEFLTREGCVQTPTMRSRLDEAIKGMAKALTYTMADLDALPTTDTRKAYPTPSVLYGGVDLFGMAALKPPYREPT